MTQLAMVRELSTITRVFPGECVLLFSLCYVSASRSVATHGTLFFKATSNFQHRKGAVLAQGGHTAPSETQKHLFVGDLYDSQSGRPRDN
jgi:hypothetical protein